jgi:hypothetical protein
VTSSTPSSAAARTSRCAPRFFFGAAFRVVRGLAAATAAFVAVAPSLGAGCAPPPVCSEKEPLVVANAWTFVEPGEDTLWPAPEGAALCSADDIQIASFGADDAVEVDTRFGCGWATVSQPLAASLAAGDRVQVRIFYFSQATFPEAQAEVAVALDDDVVVSEKVDIPASSGLVAPVVVVDHDVAAGALAHFHVGNHGDNSWNLIELSRVFDVPCDDEP